jgi:hypothetical protein
LKKFSMELGGKSPVDRLSQALIAALNSRRSRPASRPWAPSRCPVPRPKWRASPARSVTLGPADPAAGPEDGLSDGSRAPFAAST